MRQKIRNAIASTSMGNNPEWNDDNLAIALCTYFEDSNERPEDDEEDDECWSPWVRECYNETIDRIVDAVLKVHPLPNGESDNGTD